ncbi:hypothetical protein E5D57_007210 [Metarhizium anisopliae]|nr:hypothetical protein E5D57_007210 [Metarhizium anisopliae]
MAQVEYRWVEQRVVGQSKRPAEEVAASKETPKGCLAEAGKRRWVAVCKAPGGCLEEVEFNDWTSEGE